MKKVALSIIAFLVLIVCIIAYFLGIGGEKSKTMID